MDFHFPYVSTPTSRPIVSLGGRTSRPRPLVPLVVINPKTGTWRRYRGLLDTGADDTVFHVDDAQLLGIDLSQADTGQAQGTTGGPVPLRYAEVFLQIANADGEVLEWRATVAFAQKEGRHPLLGFAGFLQFFDATFSGEHEECELTPNALLPSHPPTVVMP